MLVNITSTELENNVKATQNLISLEIDKFKDVIVNKFKDLPSIFKKKIKILV